MAIKIKKFKQPIEVSWGELQKEMDVAEKALLVEINKWKDKNPDVKILSITPIRNAHLGDFCEERYVELTVTYEV